MRSASFAASNVPISTLSAVISKYQRLQNFTPHQHVQDNSIINELLRVHQAVDNWRLRL